MRTIIVFTVAGICLFITNMAMAVSIQWKTEDGGNDHWYDVVQYVSTWEQANAHAQTQTLNGVQGNLVTLTGEEEQGFVWSNFPNNAYWLGAYQTDKTSEPGGNWAWVTGEPWSYTNWASGEPNNDDLSEDVMQFGSGGSWNDQKNSKLAGGYIIEYVSSSIDDPDDDDSSGDDSDDGDDAADDGIVDTDGDGVIDQWDQCSGTPSGSAVYSNGCVAQTSGSDQCTATFDLFTNMLHVPCLDMGKSYWLDLKLVPGSDPITFELIDFNEN